MDKLRRKQQNLNSAYTSGLKKKRTLSQSNRKYMTSNKQNIQMDNQEPFYNFD